MTDADHLYDNCPVEPADQGELALRTIAMPMDTNPNGDIFGGWVVSQMDLAGLSVAQRIAKSRVTTVAIHNMSFLFPVKVGDLICCYVKLIKIGNTSLQLRLVTWAIGVKDTDYHQVTEGVFTYVALDEKGKPQPVKR